MSWVLLSVVLSGIVLQEDSPVSAVRLMDVTGDGRRDLLEIGVDGELILSIHRGGREYDLVHQPMPLPRVVVEDVLIADLNDDGHLDLYLVSLEANVALLGDSTGVFLESTDQLGLGDTGRGTAALREDLDEDGRPDLLLRNQGGDVVFWAEGHGIYSRGRLGTPWAPDLGSGPASTGAGTPASPGGIRRLPPGGEPGTPVSAGQPGNLGGRAKSSGLLRRSGPAASISGSSDRQALAPAPMPTRGIGGQISKQPPMREDDGSGTQGSGPGVGGSGSTGGLAPRGQTSDERYVNDDQNEVEGSTDIVDETVTGSDIQDGSLTGADVSTSTGDVTFSGGNLTLPDGRLDIQGSHGSSYYRASDGLLGLRIGANSFANSVRFNQAGNSVSELSADGLGTHWDLFGAPLTLENGHLGVGTRSPDVRIHVTGGTDASPAGGGYLQTGSSAGANVAIDENEIMARFNGAPATLSLNRDGGPVQVGDRVRVDNDGGGGLFTATLWAENESTGAGIALVGKTSGTDATAVLTAEGSGPILRGFNGGASPVFVVNQGGDVKTTGIEVTGNLGVGTAAPELRLHVRGGTDTGPTGGGYIQTGDTTGWNISIDENEIMARNNGTTSPLYLNREGGPVEIGDRVRIDNDGASGLSTATIWAENQSTGAGIALVGKTHGSDATAVLTQNGPGTILKAFNGGCCPVFEVTNTGRVITTALQITGGGDLVEGFESTDERWLEPGSVVSIDPENPGRLVLSTESYDSKVAGVVSGAGDVRHGIRMGQDDVLDGDTLLAMAGRVYVRCTMENGAIRPGDLITTASLAGHGMKATDRERSFGTVIGKAMSSLESETGLVLVLVNLQ